MEKELEEVVRLLAANGWPFRVHATYNETIARFLEIFERVNDDIPLDQLGWFIDHAETITPENIERIKKMGGGIAVQHRMAYQGEYFISRYGRNAAMTSPPLRRILEMGVPIGGGTDATRVSGYNPWIALYWLTTGRTIGGTKLYDESNRLGRIEALKIMTNGSAWFSREQDVKGTIEPDKYADFAILSADYFSVADEDIKNITSVMTVLGGGVVYADAEFKKYGPADLPVSPDWSPTKRYGGYYLADKNHNGHASALTSAAASKNLNSTSTIHAHNHAHTILSEDGEWNLNCPCYVG
jgi:predicted amidohydrolase YtcJ